jgi:hypothetical protein
MERLDRDQRLEIVQHRVIGTHRFDVMWSAEDDTVTDRGGLRITVRADVGEDRLERRVGIAVRRRLAGGGKFNLRTAGVGAVGGVLQRGRATVQAQDYASDDGSYQVRMPGAR